MTHIVLAGHWSKLASARLGDLAASKSEKAGDPLPDNGYEVTEIGEISISTERRHQNGAKQRRNKLQD